MSYGTSEGLSNEEPRKGEGLLLKGVKGSEYPKDSTDPDNLKNLDLKKDIDTDKESGLWIGNEWIPDSKLTKEQEQLYLFKYGKIKDGWYHRSSQGGDSKEIQNKVDIMREYGDLIAISNHVDTYRPEISKKKVEQLKSQYEKNEMVEVTDEQFNDVICKTFNSDLTLKENSGYIPYVANQTELKTPWDTTDNGGLTFPKGPAPTDTGEKLQVDVQVPEYDHINPSHYGNIPGVDNPYEVIKLIEMFADDFVEGNILKYFLRHKKKNGLEDLKKCQWYLNRLINRWEEGKI